MPQQHIAAAASKGSGVPGPRPARGRIAVRRYRIFRLPTRFGNAALRTGTSRGSSGAGASTQPPARAPLSAATAHQQAGPQLCRIGGNAVAEP